jgi:hypothetical protein
MNIKNFTRYNTDDLAALIQRVEDSIKEYTGEPAKPRVDYIEFHETNPSDPMQVTRSWDNASNSYLASYSRKWVSRKDYNQANRVNLLTPNKLYDSPLEQLAAETVSDIRTAPVDMVRFLIVELRTLYFGELGNFQVIVPSSDMALRIERQAASKVPLSVKQKVRLGHAWRNAKWARSSLRDAHHDVIKVIRYLELAEKFGKSESTEIGALLETARNLKQVLLQSYSVDIIDIVQTYTDALEAAERESAQ